MNIWHDEWFGSDHFKAVINHEGVVLDAEMANEYERTVAAQAARIEALTKALRQHCDERGPYYRRPDYVLAALRQGQPAGEGEA